MTTARLSIILLCVLAAMPARAEAAKPDYAAIVRQVIKREKPAYDRFATAAGTLDKAVAADCGTTDGKRNKALHDAFHHAADAWQAVQHLRSGPAAALNAHARLNFWPDPHDRVAKHMRRRLYQAAPSSQAVAIAERSVAIQGFPALEFLFFGEGGEAAGTAKICPIARAVADNIKAIADALKARWRPETFAAAPAKDTATHFYKDLATGFQVLADVKLAGPLGEKTGRVRPGWAENAPSRRGMRNIARNLDGLARLYAAIIDGAGKGFAGTPSDKGIRRNFRAVAADAEALGPSLAAALADDKGRAACADLMQRIRDLRDRIVVDTASRLNFILGFNSIDGD